EVAGVGGGADQRAEAGGLQGAALEVAVLGEDAGVPGPAGGGDHAGDQEGEDAGQDQLAPALAAGETEDARRLAQVARDAHGAGDDVEEDVPLGAEEDEDDRREAEPAPLADQEEE